MHLKLMYITKDPEVARIAERAGVDRIFIDMEYIGKSVRQGGMDTVQLHHTPADAKRVKAVLTKAELLVRVNPIHDAADAYSSTEQEIDETVAAGADIIMLPYFKTVAEVERFLRAVNGRAKTMLLLETKEAVAALNDILLLRGIDYIHIGLNDLSISCGISFMFTLLANGMVEDLCARIAKAGIEYGFGGIASVDKGDLPGAHIIREHYRLGSKCAILSRSFCNTQKITDLNEINSIFTSGVSAIRALEAECACADEAYFLANKRELERKVAAIEAAKRV